MPVILMSRAFFLAEDVFGGEQIIFWGRGGMNVQMRSFWGAGEMLYLYAKSIVGWENCGGFLQVWKFFEILIYVFYYVIVARRMC